MAPELKKFVQNRNLDAQNFEEKDYHRADVFTFSLCILYAFLKLDEKKIYVLNSDINKLQNYIDQIKS